MFSQRHYEQIAEYFRNRIPRVYPPSWEDCEGLALLFAEDNPRFNKVRFLTACGHPDYQA